MLPSQQLGCNVSSSYSREEPHTHCDILVENHGFGEHVWEIDIKTIPKLLYWCKTFRLPYPTALIVFSLPMRSLLRYHNRSHQDIDPPFLPASFSNSRFSDPMLVGNGLCPRMFVRVRNCDDIPVSPSIVCLE